MKFRIQYRTKCPKSWVFDDLQQKIVMREKKDYKCQAQMLLWMIYNKGGQAK